MTKGTKKNKQNIVHPFKPCLTFTKSLANIIRWNMKDYYVGLKSQINVHMQEKSRGIDLIMLFTYLPRYKIAGLGIRETYGRLKRISLSLLFF